MRVRKHLLALAASLACALSIPAGSALALGLGAAEVPVDVGGDLRVAVQQALEVLVLEAQQTDGGRGLDGGGARLGVQNGQLRGKLTGAADGELPGAADLAAMCDAASATFRHEAVVPLVQIGHDQWIAELFHGPTLAFKDLALQLVGRMFDHVLSQRGGPARGLMLAGRRAELAMVSTLLERVVAGRRGRTVVVRGEPGIGKSTLLLQALASMAAAGATCLYVSAEESARQVALRGERLGVTAPNLRLDAETVSLGEAAGRVLAEDLAAHQPLPPFDYSAMDGYAVLSTDLVGAGPWPLPVRAESRAGQVPERHTAGTACRIFTGAPLPDGADTVILQEDVDRSGDRIVVRERPRQGDNIRRRGADLSRGATALSAGMRLDPGRLGLLAALDRAWATVARRPGEGSVGTAAEPPAVWGGAARGGGAKMITPFFATPHISQHSLSQTTNNEKKKKTKTKKKKKKKKKKISQFIIIKIHSE